MAWFLSAYVKMKMGLLLYSALPPSHLCMKYLLSWRRRMDEGWGQKMLKTYKSSMWRISYEEAKTCSICFALHSITIHNDEGSLMRTTISK